MNEQKFWQLIEQSWKKHPQLESLRKEVLSNNIEEQVLELSGFVGADIANQLGEELSSLKKEDLSKFIHIMEEKLFNIDRKEIHEFTDGSDDGFLYCRGFIVGMGEEYYNKIDKNPSLATMDAEAELFGFVAYSTYEQVFDEEFDRYSIHSIESCSNANGWKD